MRTSQAIFPGVIPPRPGLEKEEPELVDELDIPTDDSRQASSEATPEGSRETSSE